MYTPVILVKLFLKAFYIVNNAIWKESRQIFWWRRKEVGTSLQLGSFLWKESNEDRR